MEDLNFVMFPRYIAKDFKSGKICRNEFILYSWLRSNLDPYGVVTVALPALREDIFNGVTENYISKLLLSLRSKKYLHYPTRQGRRGSFEVHMGDLKMPNGQIKTLNRFFDNEEVRSIDVELAEVPTEVNQTFDIPSQKLDGIKKQLAEAFSTSNKRPRVRSHYNDNEIENENNNLSFGKKSFKRTSVESFKPDSTKMLRCAEIAKALGEKDMNFILSIFNNHGMGLIERAWSQYVEQVKNSEIQNHPAYFNGIVQKLLENS